MFMTCTCTYTIYISFVTILNLVLFYFARHGSTALFLALRFRAIFQALTFSLHYKNIFIVMDLQVQQQSPLFFINSINAKNIPSNNSNPAKCELGTQSPRHAHLAFKFQFPEFLHLAICSAVRVIICTHAYQIMTSSAYNSLGYSSFFL